MVEERYGYEVVDNVMQKATLASGGAYTAVGSYSHEEAFVLIALLTEETGVSSDDLIEAYCEHLFIMFTKSYSEFFKGETSAFAFISKIEDKIHPQVLKLYPDAELPRFEMVHSSPDRLEIIYFSSRKMGKFAEGLIKGCLKYFKEEAKVETESFDNGEKVRFSITK